ncbi:riboflavin transporter [bacterium BMS3Bbin10]|nr:riboflavin transporter [bacterium BMS3Bbin10]
MLFGAALISLNDALVKTLTSTYPVGEVLLIRGLFILPWILFLAYRAGSLEVLRVKNPGGQAVRALCVVASSFLFVNGLIHLQLADAIAITFTGPLFITALAPFALGEFVGWRRWLAVSIGFVGILFIFRPGYGAMQWAVLFPLGAALCGGVRDLITRRISRSETSVAVLLVTTCAVILAGLATVPFAWVQIRVGDLGTFAASGMLIAGGHYLMIEAFRHGEAALVAPFKYTSMVWAVLFGFLIFGQLPDQWTLVGTAIVIGAGLYVLHREVRLTRSPIAAGPRPPSRM